MRLSRLDVAASYSPDDELDSDEKVHLDLEFDYWKWEFRGTWNRADFYDLFGPTKKSRRGWSLSYEYEDIVIYDDPRFLSMATGGEHWGDLETLPDFQNIEATASELDTAWARVEFDHLRQSQGAVEDFEKGLAWDLEATVDYVNSDVIPRLLGTLDRGFTLPINHSSLWLRGAAGYAFGDVDDDFSRFFFGGFGNNYVDHETEKRYREYYSFPGLELNEVGGRSFAKAMLEWTLPPVRFRSVGNSGFYLNWAAPRAVRRRSPDRSGPRRPRAHPVDRRRADRLQDGDLLEPAEHAVGGLRPFLRGRRRVLRRGHDLAEDPLTAATAAHFSSR